MSLLRRLGYRAERRYVADTGRYFETLNKHPEAQAGFISWVNISLAADMFGTLGCGANYAYFCDRRVDRDVKALLDKQVADPTAGAAQAARLDRELVNRAPWVPVMTPRWADLTSASVGNWQVNPWNGPLIDQMWVVR